MSKLLDHLRSPQYTDEDGNKTTNARLPVLVAPGSPRWLGYAFYLGIFIVSAALALGLLDIGDDFMQELIGVVAMLGAVLGAVEVWYGKPFSLRRR